MAKFPEFQESYRSEERYEFDRRIAGTMNTIAAQLHVILRIGKDIGVRTPQGILLERADGTTKYVVRAGNEPLRDPLEIDMRGLGNYRAARNQDGSFDWGPSPTSAFPREWQAHPLAIDFVGQNVAARLERLYAKIRDEFRAILAASGPDGRSLA